MVWFVVGCFVSFYLPKVFNEGVEAWEVGRAGYELRTWVEAASVMRKLVCFFIARDPHMGWDPAKGH